jgi:5-oxoprolinase (ATP-hydrolysing)
LLFVISQNGINIHFLPTFDNMNDKWQIWIDTGGTFTDCIAVNPEGGIVRTKVLSSSALRGVVIKKTGPRKFLVRHKWPVVKNIFTGYRLSFPAFPGHRTFGVVGFSPSAQILELDQDVETDITGSDFELSSGEEAPILAARLATQTPLDHPLPPADMRLGFTKGTNALLEKKGAKTALLITSGFADLPVIGTQQRPNLFALDLPEPFQIHRTVIEVEERLDASGKVLKPLLTSEIERVVAALRKTDAESIAVALLHSYRNPEHEIALGNALRQAGFRFVSLSHILFPAIKLLPRAQTTLVNAYLAPLLDDYLIGIEAALRHGHDTSTLRLMSSAGGLTPLSAFHPKDSLLSGPAGGASGAKDIALRLGFPQILTLDMGGTSTDCTRIDERYHYRYTTRIGEIEIQSPAIAIETVAAGGGSVCYFDGRQLCVGPESAGAFPGPAAYGAGGPLTITDVNLLLGKLDPSEMGIPVHIEAAKAALNKIEQELSSKTGTKTSRTALLKGFEAIANEKMAGAIRKISVAQGFDPKVYSLLAFGGAGGLHACQIAARLGIQRVILPSDAGLLSAYGIGKASIQRFVHRQILQPWNIFSQHAAITIEALFKEAESLLIAEGSISDPTERGDALLYLRLEKQENTLEVSALNLATAPAAYEEKYRETFGYFPTGRTLEVESVKVIVQTVSPKPQPCTPVNNLFSATPHRFSSAQEENDMPRYPVYDRQRLDPGATVDGPAILLSPTSSAFIEPGWRMIVTSDGHAILEDQNQAVAPNEDYQEAVELSLFTNRFTAIAEEMGAQLQRTALSVNIKERLDFSCALLDPSGGLLVNAPHIPVHLGSLGICGRLMLGALPLEPGDVLITNHPRYGGSHLPDVTLLCGVFSTGGRCIGYAINRAHHAEIGGRTPGSMPPDAHTLIEEGVAITPRYLVRKGIPQWEAIEQLLRESPFPSRAIDENIADLQASLAALKAGEKGLQELSAIYGEDKALYYMKKIKESAAVALSAALEKMEGGKYSAQEALDDGHIISVRMEVRQGHLYIDFTGTSPTHPFNLNANLSIVYSAVIYVLRLLCNKEIPLNEGLLEHVSIQLPTCFLNPDFSDNPIFCPAVVGGNTEVSQRLVDTLLKALGLAACSQGTMNNFLFGDRRFGYYETVAGGCGAGPGFHGRSAVHQHMTNTRITDPEDIELRYPARLWRFAIRKGSGGDGRWKGGDGVIREWEFLRPVKITLLSQHRKVPPYGMAGGNAGQCGQQWVIEEDGHRKPMSGIESRTIEAGGRIIIETPGGGGYEYP